MLRSVSLAAILSLIALTSSAQENLTRLLRQPDIQGKSVAFVYAGDIWIADVSGGNARRLTSHEGLELFPKFSPDGRRIAFTGDYSGSRQVHVISVDGGEPKQLTFYNDVGALPPRGGIDNRILDWSPDGKNILFLPHRLPWSDRMGIPYVVPADGGTEKALAIPEAGGGMYSPDGTKIVYTPIEREFRTWKRYRGGRAQDVWIYDLERNKAEQITSDKATDNQPVWVKDTIYFTSDRDRLLNLYAYDTRTKQTKKVTTHADFDVLWPSASADQIVYEAGGYIYRYDPALGQPSRIPIRIASDLKTTLPRFQNVKTNIGNFSLSPSGARALLGARGDIFTVPAKDGEIRNLTQTPGVRELDPAWSPDGKWIAYLSDRTGEYELWVRGAEAAATERQVTRGGKSWRFAPVWSPDSKKLAFADTESLLQYVEVSSGQITEVDRGIYDNITYYRWAPDSRWLAYNRDSETRLSTIFLHSVEQGKNFQLTSGMTSDSTPTFDPKGRYLYFTSDRDFNLTFSGFEFNYVYTDPTRIYVGLLADDGPALFLPTSDEEIAAAQTAAEKAPVAATSEVKSDATVGATPAKQDTTAVKGAMAPIRIDIAGFERRVRAIPGAPGNYRAIEALPNGVLYLTGTGPLTALKLYNIDDKKEETVLEGVAGYDLSANREKIIFRKGLDYGIIPAKPAQKADALLALDKLEMRIEPRAEWAQQYNDAWRLLRDWFYDPKMHGLDWAGVKAKYAPLVPHVAHRSDLDYILGEVAGELNAGHVYVETSQDWQVKRVENGLLGAEIEPHESGYFRIARIFPGENWHESFRSPLTEPGVRVKAGDFILAVDGTSTKGVDNFYRLMENKANRTVTLRVSSQPDGAGAHDERVKPTRKETNLRYLDWVASRRAMVEKLSGGRIGYIHLPNTGQEGNRELFKNFYPQARKEALIIDDRYNGGGFIPDRMIELLDRDVLSYWARRNIEPSVTPAFAHRGPKAMLINGYSASGGDALPYYFRKRNLGTIIGTRTWGGLIGLSGGPSLMDGGAINVPTFRFFDTEGKWAVENEGVSPDIEVVDRPDLVAAGQDPSLEKAIEVLLEQLKKTPVRAVVTPTPPSDAPKN